MPRRAVLVFAAAVLLVAAALGGYAWMNRHAVAPQGSGVALVGGPFTLTDQEGRRVTEKDFLGRYMLVFFGFTYCPDICPTELQVMTAALDAMGPAAEKIQPVFVSIDPERDTPEVMKAYMGAFDPSFVALIPTADELVATAKDFKVYYKKVDGKTPTSYSMDHSAASFVYDPQGRLRLYARYGAGVPPMVADIKTLLAA